MAKKLTKRMQNLLNKVDCKKIYDITTASAKVKDLASAKFDETIEIALSLGVDPRHADQMIRGAVVLPNGTGKRVRVAVFAKGAKADEAAERRTSAGSRHKNYSVFCGDKAGTR